MRAMRDAGSIPDELTLISELNRFGELEDIGGVAYVSRLTIGVPKNANVQYFAKTISDTARARVIRRDLAQAAGLAAAGSLDQAVALAAAAASMAARHEAPTDRFERRVTETLEHERAKREARRRLELEATKNGPVPDIATLRDRLARPIVDQTYRVDALQPRKTRVMLSAQFKAGKTTLIGNYIASLADERRDFLGRYRTEPVRGAIVLVDTEMSGRQLDDWLKDQRIERDDRVLVVSLRGALTTFNLLDPVIRGQWADAFRAVGAEVLIIDCLRPILDTFGLDEHRDGGRLLVAIDELILEAGIEEAVAVHHMGHSGERARGDSRFRDWPDVEWRLVRQDEEPGSPRFFSAYGRDVDVAESRLDYDAMTRRLTVAGGSRRDAATDSALAAVLDVLGSSDEGLSVRAIQKALEDSDIARDAVRAAIQRGAREGAIHVQNGPRGAKLHRLFRQRAGVCDERAAHSANECAAASIEAARSHARLDDGEMD
jgi:hypothetical protein